MCGLDSGLNRACFQRFRVRSSRLLVGGAGWLRFGRRSRLRNWGTRSFIIRRTGCAMCVRSAKRDSFVLYERMQCGHVRDKNDSWIGSSSGLRVLVRLRWGTSRGEVEVFERGRAEQFGRGTWRAILLDFGKFVH